jgi:hypothetical protein
VPMLPVGQKVKLLAGYLGYTQDRPGVIVEVLKGNHYSVRVLHTGAVHQAVPERMLLPAADQMQAPARAAAPPAMPAADREETRTVKAARQRYKLAGEVGPLLDVRGQHFNPLGRQAAAPQSGKRESLSKEVKQAVWTRDGGRCRGCGITDSAAVTRDGEHLHYDHVIAWSRGGADIAENIQLLCGRCNRAKGAS